MNQEHDEQTRWLVSYLETRFGRLEDRLSSVTGGLEDRLDRAIDKVDQAILAQSVRVDAIEDKVNQVENEQLKLSNQAGLVRNLLAFVGTAVLSLAGWAITYFWPSGGK